MLLRRLALSVQILVCASLSSCLLAQAQVAARKSMTPHSHSDSGKRIFSSSCAQCHGLDGKGSERAPNIAERESVLRLSDAQVSQVIENGVPGTGMPAFHSLSSVQVGAVVQYLRTLQGRSQTVALPGNPRQGKAIFFGKAGCSECHMAGGEGGFIASDLSNYARSHTLEQMREAIMNPSAGKQVHSVTVTLRSGERYIGRLRNEDNFSVQLQTLDGAFHFLDRSDIEKLEAGSQPLMPVDYATKLDSRELNDVISFLLSIGSGGPANTKQPEEGEQ